MTDAQPAPAGHELDAWPNQFLASKLYLPQVQPHLLPRPRLTLPP